MKLTYLCNNCNEIICIPSTTTNHQEDFKNVVTTPLQMIPCRPKTKKESDYLGKLSDILHGHFEGKTVEDQWIRGWLPLEKI